MSSKRPVTPGSRFAEGSMNDRTSAAPPPHFLGPDLRDASTRSSASLPNFPAHSDGGGGDHAAPTTHDGATRPQRPRSVSGSEKKGLSGFWEGLRGKIWGGRKQQQQQQQRPVSLDAGVAAAAAAAATLQGAGDAPRPTREEMMASYNELMESGFFEARAIRGTRQPPPAGQGQGVAPSHRQAYTRPRLETIYSPPRIVPAPTATTPGAADDTATTPDSRGKKRAHDTEAGEDRTVRKLRRTTRSITELHSRLRRAREDSHPPVSYPGSGSSGRRSFSGSGGARLAKRNPARPSSSGKGAGAGGERVRISAPVTPVVKLAPGVFDAMRAPPPPGPVVAGGSMRLRKRQGDASLRARTSGEVPWGAESAVARPPGGDAAIQESANWVSLAKPGLEAPASPRHQQRQGSTSPRKKEPLCVVPDANRGIPNVPAIPAHFKAPAGGVDTDTEMENGGLRTFYAGDSFAEDILLPRESLVR